MQKKVNILDTTLRDGSYAINFSFTALDTAAVCRALESAGVEWIEAGHGAGFNAGQSGHGLPAASDEEYMEAARGALQSSKYGMFCIPGIARLSDLDLAAKHKMNFVRIGTNVDRIPDSEKFIKRAKELGMFVAANFMKSYVLGPEDFAEQVCVSEKYGADIVYVVDSAGGMLPGLLEKYYRAIRKRSNVRLGFHAHNNLGFAVSNSFEAIQLGFDFVDSSLQGMGRSSGNACTEVLIAALEKAGISTGIDFHEILKVGHRYIWNLIQKRGELPLDVISGLADFHSSYMPQILKCAAKYQVDPGRLIIEVCKVSRVDIRAGLLDEIGAKLPKLKDLYIGDYRISRYVGNEQDSQ